MTIYSSSARQGFYDDTINADIPGDALSITNDQYVMLLEGQSMGQLIDFTQHPPKLREREKVWPTAQELSNRIDNQVAKIYALWTRFISEYQAKEVAALSYKLAGYKGDAGAWISSYADSAGLDYMEATDRILSQAESLRSAQAEIGQLRMRKFELSGLEDEPRYQLYESIVAGIEKISAAFEPII